MGTRTGIQWTEATWNPTTGCHKVSPGCKRCYAKREWARLAANPKTVYYGRAFEDVQVHPERLEMPLGLTKPRMIFVDSMSDLFHQDVPDTFIDKVFAVMALAKHHTFQVLTKRTDRMLAYLKNPIREALIGQQAGLLYLGRSGFPVLEWTGLPLPNVWLGASTEDQEYFDIRWNYLRQVDAAVRFISYEPALGMIAGLPPETADELHWVIAGGESGPKAEPSHPDWFRVMRDACQMAGIPFFFKQWGEWRPALI